ncbi:MAG: glycosyltransferase family 9 protein [Phycisphaerales bacterium]
MDPAIYQKKWFKLRDGKADADELQHLARQVAFSFIDKHFQSGTYVAEYIDLLCEMATFYSKTELSNIASTALFEVVVEKLCDDFEDLPVEVYSRVMCQVISYCRTVPAGKGLDAKLTDFGIVSPDELYRRAVATHTRQYRRDPGKAPRRIVLLSRVTLGADVAILSVMIQRLRRLFPETDMVIVGSHKLGGLFGGNPDVRIRELGYARRGGLFERFASWHATLDILREEFADGEENVLVIDPDSRISQLGLLPVMHADNYLFFNTRDHVLTANGHCMAEWTNEWINNVFGVPDFAYPVIWAPPALMTTAKAKIDSLRAAGARHIIAMNLGVGQNPRKRVSLEFEKRLVRAIVAVPGTVVVLDRGFGADEEERAALLIADTREHGFPGTVTSFTATDGPALPHGVVAIECGIGAMASLIAHSDEYIGYDSACQHIAAAARTPTLTIFAGSNNKNFIRRWSACGETDCRIVHVNTLTDSEHVDVNEVIARVMQERALRTPEPSRQQVREVRTGRTTGNNSAHEARKE